MSQIFILFIVLFILGVVFVFRYQYIMDKERIYVHKSTGGRYKPLYSCKMKDITSRKWVEAVAYTNLNTGELYIRERRDFLKKFITLKEMEEYNNDSTNRR